MVKFFKKLFTLAIFSALGYLGYKIFRIIKATIDLDKVLPQYLENVYGEKPSISIQITLNKIVLTAGFGESLFNKKVELEKAIQDYVKDFYPTICANRLEVNVIEKDIETKTEPEKKPKNTSTKEIDKEDSSEETTGKGWSI